MASGQKMRKMDSLRGPPVKTERGLRAAWRHPALRTIHLWQLRPEASRRCWLSATCCCAGASMLVVSKTKVPKFQRSSLAWCLGPCFCRQLLASHALRVHLLLPASLRPDCQHLTPHCRTEQPGAPGMPSSARAKDERHSRSLSYTSIHQRPRASLRRGLRRVHHLAGAASKARSFQNVAALSNACLRVGSWNSFLRRCVYVFWSVRSNMKMNCTWAEQLICLFTAGSMPGRGDRLRFHCRDEDLTAGVAQLAGAHFAIHVQAQAFDCAVNTHGCGSKPMESHFGVGAPPILVYFSGDWDVHWEITGLLTHGHMVSQNLVPSCDRW